MSDDFKKRLDDYAEGKLSSEEEMELNKELEKMEQYQAHLDEQMGPNKKNIDFEHYNKKQQKILKRGKWKARFQNGLTAIGILIIVTLLCSFLTTAFYALGNRGEVYNDVIKSTIAFTKPNSKVISESFSPNTFFTMNWSGELSKEIGDDIETSNKYNMNFLFHSPWSMDNQLKNKQSDYFISPNHNDNPKNDWDKLENLPEGTVVEAYISFDQFYTTSQVFNRLQGQNYRPVWFAVESGQNKENENSNNIHNSTIGMPLIPVNQSSTSESGNGSISSQQVINSPENRNDKFIQTLRLMRDYEHISEEIIADPSFNLDNTIRFIEENGVNIYGAVITGPTKEILNLQDEGWVSDVSVGESRLWNWNQ
ncbi:anti-sigma factor [Thalassobacillus sp. CUG 92003]|uniref:anti-sigma factor n=1 Tax=Thalassobacillus sp. CUG 92003 TaxID=2736641 RepID=UPI0015E7CC46|nr:anti-sigma factor [Thalassobacillus sp. CUG 92003]